MSARFTPIIVGVGDIKNPSLKPEDAVEPAELMLQAIGKAIQDATDHPSASSTAANRLKSSIDSLDTVATWTWPYPDLPGLLSKRLGVKPKHQAYSAHSGREPARLFDDAARRISLGESRVAVVTGGEALASLNACARAGQLPPPGWTAIERDLASVFSPSTMALKPGIGATHSIGAPIHIYPLYENGLRAHRGQSIAENHNESAKLYAEFAEIAEGNPLAWFYGKNAETESTIGTVTKRNRMICFPYPLLMNAFNLVNLAGACILTSTEYAAELGIPESKWIYPLGGAGTRESDDFWQRPNFYSSPAVSQSLDAGLRVSGLTKDQIDLFDFYSCFPIVPKLACQHLDLPITLPRPTPITLLGGLTSFGGAGNNYSMHALTEMTRRLRHGTAKTGLVLANGGSLTYQHVTCLSSEPRKDGKPYPDKNPLPDSVADAYPVPEIEKHAEGEAVVETYTVEFARNGSPSRGYVVGRLVSSGKRFVANHGDAATLEGLASRVREPIGRKGWVRREEGGKGRNLFSFDKEEAESRGKGNRDGKL